MRWKFLSSHSILKSKLIMLFHEHSLNTPSRSSGRDSQVRSSDLVHWIVQLSQKNHKNVLIFHAPQILLITSCPCATQATALHAWNVWLTAVKHLWNKTQQKLKLCKKHASMLFDKIYLDPKSKTYCKNQGSVQNLPHKLAKQCNPTYNCAWDSKWLLKS